MTNLSEYTVLGLMSGTSLDGLDMALCRFTKENSEWRYSVIASATRPYDEPLRLRLSAATDLSALEYVRLDAQLACVMAGYINDFLAQQTLKPDFIASHGQTIFHQPVETPNLGVSTGFTSQIGNGAVIAASTGITTVCDFRTLDVALGGQGAPLVPIGDELLFGRYDACLNLGGFSNISLRRNGKRIAFDVSPCNMALNYLAEKLGMTYDKDGLTARKGLIINELLNKLNNIPFYGMKGAKSLGKEWFDREFRPLLEAANFPVADLLRTVIEHIAQQVAISGQGDEGTRGQGDEETSGQGDEGTSGQGQTILITGGGARNKFLIERIKALCNKTVIVPDDETVDFKEAIIFAFLGILRMRGETNCLRDVTGASVDNCGGAIYFR